MKVKVVIIDDEQAAIDQLKVLLSELPEFEVIKSFTDPKLALDFIISSGRIDLLFLDVDMPKISGIELASTVRLQLEKLIFTTAHTQYAFEAYELQADAFLRKPFGLAKLLTTLRKIYPVPTQSSEQREVVGSIVDHFIFIKPIQDSRLMKINLSDIAVIESKNNYVELVAGNKQIVTYMSLQDLAKKLNGQSDFIQVQRSFIINKNYIEYIDGNLLKMASGITIAVGAIYRDQFNLFVEERLFKGGRKR